MNNDCITRKENFKYLGLMLDFNLRWHLHINNIVKKCRFFLYICEKLSYLPKRVLESIYNGYIYIYIVYLTMVL